ncbi:MAG: aminotransferase class I/II-fold pyridoxal phosphate-dependent enzyme [Chloroflexota bacterium]|nr:aminotransferase class I/II-fold pyridoxal phosphate-dependent enzyme [Chloroflexota bacterium]
MNTSWLAQCGLRTQAVHGGVVPDPVTGAIAPVISPAVNFAAKFGEIGLSAAGSDTDAFVYSREGHPNGRQLEQRLALLEGGEEALVFASGMAAIAALCLQLLDAGDHIIVGDVSYAGSAELLRDMLPAKGIDVTVADLSVPAEVQAALRPRTRLVFGETPCNPTTKLFDIAAVAEMTRSAGALLVVDSTFATPVVSLPLALGADLVVHSLSKFIGGHGDALGGAVVGRAAVIGQLRANLGIRLGGVLSPFDAWLILRGSETLELRLRASCDSAARLAAALEAHPGVARVLYPGLPSHPQYALAQEQMRLPGAMLAFAVPDAQAFGQALAERGRLITYATSLGLTRTVVLYCDTADLQHTTYRFDEAHLARYQAWAGAGVFRLSPGLEDPADLLAELDDVLSAASRAA